MTAKDITIKKPVPMIAGRKGINVTGKVAAVTTAEKARIKELMRFIKKSHTCSMKPSILSKNSNIRYPPLRLDDLRCVDDLPRSGGLLRSDEERPSTTRDKI